jgi:hypothetical protein
VNRERARLLALRLGSCDYRSPPRRKTRRTIQRHHGESVHRSRHRRIHGARSHGSVGLPREPDRRATKGQHIRFRCSSVSGRTVSRVSAEDGKVEPCRRFRRHVRWPESRLPSKKRSSGGARRQDRQSDRHCRYCRRPAAAHRQVVATAQNAATPLAASNRADESYHWFRRRQPRGLQEPKPRVEARSLQIR